MARQLVPKVKGTRDFYPEDMAFRNWLYGVVKKISEKYGYQEFDGPNIEYLDLFADKTSEEILKEQAFSLKDRDGKDILLRPEITPTFARMVAQKSGSLVKPIRWFSFGRAYRYEQPQKGREREFFQWEINILGPETPEADAEIIAIAVEYFKELGLTPEEVVIKVNDRSYFETFCQEINIPQEKVNPLIRLIDKKCKMSGTWFEDSLKELGISEEQISKLNEFLQNKDYTKSPWLNQLFKALALYQGVLDYVKFDSMIARGFEYYTRTVFEAWDKTGGLKRAIFGGGRFDDLTETLGGERLPGVGMAPGDVPIQVLLEQLYKMPNLKPKSSKVLVTVFSSELLEKSIQVANKLRQSKIDTESWLEPDFKLEKQLKYADQKSIPFVVILGPDEAASEKVVLKDLTLRTQETLSLDEAVKRLRTDE